LNNFCFPKKERLTKKADFKKLTKDSKRISNKEFIFLFSKTTNNIVRIGLTVSRKVGTASTRNRIKRLIREYYRQNKHRLDKACDINIIAKKDAACLSNNQIVNSLQNMFDRLAGRL